MKLALALYLVTLTTSLALPAPHATCDDICNAQRDAARAHITNNYRDDHKGRPGVTREEQLKRDRERLALLLLERTTLDRAINRPMRGML
jgi:hypothetical protein